MIFKTYFKCLQTLVLTDTRVVELLQGFLFLKQKLELTMQRLVQSSLGSAKSWYQMPDISELCLHKEIRSMAQDTHLT